MSSLRRCGKSGRGSTERSGDDCKYQRLPPDLTPIQKAGLRRESRSTRPARWYQRESKHLLRSRDSPPAKAKDDGEETESYSSGLQADQSRRPRGRVLWSPGDAEKCPAEGSAAARESPVRGTRARCGEMGMVRRSANGQAAGLVLRGCPVRAS